MLPFISEHFKFEVKWKMFVSCNARHTSRRLQDPDRFGDISIGSAIDCSKSIPLTCWYVWRDAVENLGILKLSCLSPKSAFPIEPYQDLF